MMPDETSPPWVTTAQVQSRLDELAQLLRAGRSVDPDTRQGLAALVAELGRDLGQANLPPAEVAHLTEAIDLVVLSLKRPKERGLLRPAREGLQTMVVRAETQAPIATRFAEQLID